ncbi:hypothetical protein NEHOM01_1825, partial [Nematocida homosporus]|uniref:uncharacterized protein n=1 Tax=Nematocida homosporus TaxID=1912981 RepID=UPI0022209432
MNRYSLNVYQVVCLVIGLCCVWCSSGENSNEMELFGPSKDVALDIDSQVESVSAEITNAIDELKDLRDIQSIRIHLIRQGQPGLMKQQHYKGLKSIQSNPSCLDKLEDVFEQMEIEAISVLVKEELIWDSLNIAIQQMEEWLSEWKNTQMPEEESRVESICKLAIIARQIHQIKSDLRGLQNQFPNPKISRIEINLIAIGDQYHPIGLKARFVTIMVRELMKIRPNITISEWIHLEEIMESKIDQLLKNDELKSPDSISRLIEEALVWLDDTIKEMEVKSESERKQKPTSSEPSNSRTQSSNPQTNGSGM